MYLPAPNTADQELQLYLTASAKKEKKKFPKINKKQNIPDLQAKKKILCNHAIPLPLSLYVHILSVWVHNHQLMSLIQQIR